MMLLVLISDVMYMLATFIRAVMLVFCLGAASMAHAETYQAANNLALPASVTQRMVESSKFDILVAKAHSETDSNQATVDKGSLVWNLSQQAIPKQIISKQTTPNQANPQPQKQHSTESRDYDPALANSSRMANLLRHDPEEVQPLYQLAIELPIEPIPSLVKGYCVNFSDSLNWTLNTNPPSCRISGWKESNLTYTTYHHRFLRT